MPTPLTRPVTRRVETLRGADLIVTLAPEGIRFREPKRRTYFTLPYGVAFQIAVRLHVDSLKKEKREKSGHERAASRRCSRSLLGSRRQGSA